MQNARLDEAQAGTKIASRNVNNLSCAESEEELKSLLMKVKRRVKKLAYNSAFEKLRSWHLVPSFHGK